MSTTAQSVPGFNVEAVDTTAAGDTFNGALAVALAEGMPLLDAVRFANAAAAISVTRMGAQLSAPGRDEIEDLVKDAAVTSPHKTAFQPFQARHMIGRPRTAADVS
jgi:sugar/nucleoside kinase (ribokinase family)